jgi:hypothetical protein
MGAPSVPGSRAGCSLRGGPTRISLAPVLASRAVGRRRSHVGPHRTSRAGRRPTGTEASSGILTPPTSLNTNPGGGCTNKPGAGPRTAAAGIGGEGPDFGAGQAGPAARPRAVHDGGGGGLSCRRRPRCCPDRDLDRDRAAGAGDWPPRSRPVRLGLLGMLLGRWPSPRRLALPAHDAGPAWPPQHGRLGPELALLAGRPAEALQ